MINKNGAFGAEKQKGILPMKKIFAILMTICLLAGALSITAFAAEETTDKLPDPAADVVIRVKARDKKTAE